MIPKPKKTIDQKLMDIDNSPRLNKIANKKYSMVAKKTSAAVGNVKKLAKIENKYGYDYKTAAKFNIKPDNSNHMPSIADNGKVLKAKNHPTIKKTIKTEKVLGNKIFKVGKDRYTAPKKEAKEYKKILKKNGKG